MESLNGPYEAPLSQATLGQLGKTLRSVIEKRDRTESQSEGNDTDDLHKDNNVKGSPNDEEILRNVLSSLFKTADAEGLAIMHRVKACSTLCGFIETCLSSHGLTIQGMIGEDSCESLLQIYLDHYDSSKVKTSKQGLKTITSLISNPHDAGRAANCKKRILTRTLALTSANAEARTAKPAFFLLSLCLSKNAIVPSEILHQILDRPASFTSFLLTVFEWLSHPSVSYAAGTFLATFLEKLNTNRVCSDLFALPSWFEALYLFAEQGPEAFDLARTGLIPVLFFRDIEQYAATLDALGVQDFFHASSELSQAVDANTEASGGPDRAQEQLLLTTLQMGFDQGFLSISDEHNSREFRREETHLIASTAILTRALLANASRATRMAGISLLFSSTHIKRPLSTVALNSLLENVRHLLGDTDPRFRGDILSMFRRLFDRIRVITAPLAKSSDSGRVKVRETIHAKVCATKAVNDEHDQLRIYMTFVRRFQDLILSELNPCAPYQRRISAIKAMRIIASSGVDSTIEHAPSSVRSTSDSAWAFSLELFSPLSLRLALDLLIDPFEDVRTEAQALLVMVVPEQRIPDPPPGNDSGVSPSETPSTGDKDSHHAFGNELRALIRKLESTMVSSGRADLSDGLGRAYDLLVIDCASRGSFAASSNRAPASNMDTVEAVYENLLQSVEHAVCLAEEDLPAAVNSSPLHGLFLAIRYCIPSQSQRCRGALLKQILTLLERLLALVDRCWLCIKPVLCNDAPEGFVIDYNDYTSPMATKELLSYAWRALKEMSIMLQAIAASLADDSCSISMAPSVVKSILKRIGDLSFAQLGELRHRGAFSTVAQTFHEVCRICCHNTGQGLDYKELIDCWFARVMQLIEVRGNTITRRSAGIPSLLTGLVSADSMGDLLDMAMSQLQAIAIRTAQHTEFAVADLPQVHAMNSLRAVYTAGDLAERSAKYTVRSLQVAATCLSCEAWAVRNCGLMLFRSLLNRILGDHESLDEAFSEAETSFEFSYDQYPGLLELLSSIVSRSDQGDTQQGTEEAVFPVLDLLRRAPPSPSHWHTFQPFVLAVAGSPHWHVRVIASRAYASCTFDSSSLASLFRSLFFDQSLTRNELHGRLLIIQRICGVWLQRASRSLRNDGAGELTQAITSIDKLVLEDRHYPVIMGAYIDLINIVCKAHIVERNRSREAYDLIDLCERARAHIQLNNETMPGGVLMQKSYQLNGIMLYMLRPTGTGDALRKDRQDLVKQLAESSFAASWHAVEAFAACLDQANCETALKFGEVVVMLLQTLNDCSLNSILYSTLAETMEKLCRRRCDVVGILVEMLASMSWMPAQLAGTDPSAVESTIRISGYCMAARIQRCKELTPAFLRELRRWLSLMHACGDDNHETQLRKAAALSTRAFARAYETYHFMLPAIINAQLAFTIYDIMLDDDEDLRDIGTEAAGLWLRSNISSNRYVARPVAPYACQLLAFYLVKYHRSSPVVIKEALRRLTGIDPLSPSSVTFGSQLQQQIAKDIVLFAVERPNLYRDDVQEARLWAKVLQQMDNTALTQAALNKLTTWCSEGLDSLHDTVRQRSDGPLGWTSKPEIFALGLRLIHIAEVLLHWRSNSKRIKTRGSTIRRKLRELADDGAVRQLHEIWLMEIERVLAISVTKKIKLVGDMMLALPLSVR